MACTVLPPRDQHGVSAQSVCALLQALWLDQADAQAVAEGEEVTLMDWGNTIIRVRMLAAAPCRATGTVNIVSGLLGCRR